MSGKFRTIEELQNTPTGALTHKELKRLAEFDQKTKPVTAPGTVSVTISAAAGTISNITKGIFSTITEKKDHFLQTGMERIVMSKIDQIKHLQKEIEEIKEDIVTKKVSEEKGSDEISVRRFQIDELQNS